MKVHFDANGRGFYFPGAAECGARQSPSGTGDGPLLSTSPSHVTCLRCKKSKAYREEKAARSREDGDGNA